MDIFALYSNRNASEVKENLSTVFQYPIREDNYYINEFYIRRAKYVDTLKTRLNKYNPSLIGSPVFLVTAFYITDGNRMYLFSGLLQPPFYYQNASLASKYGALGWIISHEIMRAIGIKGVLFDENSNKRNSFDALWSSSFMQSKAVCLSNQYSSYNFTSLKAFQTDTQEEILADNNGLKASFYTYRRLLKTFSNNVSQDHYESLASDRLFFRSFAQGLCGHHGESMLEIDSVVQPHVLEKFRVTGVLVNNNRFARAYGCPVGSPMNPKLKCDVW
uniref:Peptidase_M13 domain-containing protein n=1 Tax=Schistosoma mansoni TaxID=6183 RepID=A0A5K4F8K8_SCHMA